VVGLDFFAHPVAANSKTPILIKNMKLVLKELALGFLII